MNQIAKFDFNGQAVRTITVNGEPWFVAGDVAKVLGYRKASDMTRVIDAQDKGAQMVRTAGGDQETTVITEPGLYGVIMQRQAGYIDDPAMQQQVRAFQRWVTHEVLPQIRRTGSYAAPVLTGAELMAQALIEANSTMANYRARVQELEPLATAWEKLAAASGDYSVRDAAQVLCRDGGIKIGQNRLFAHLKTAARPWLDQRSRPYQWAVDAGLVAEKISSFKFQRTNGAEQLAAPQVRITAKGLQRLHRELSAGADLVFA